MYNGNCINESTFDELDLLLFDSDENYAGKTCDDIEIEANVTLITEPFTTGDCKPY